MGLVTFLCPVLDEHMLSYSFPIFHLGDIQTRKENKIKVTRLLVFPSPFKEDIIFSLLKAFVPISICHTLSEIILLITPSKQ